MNKEIGDRYEQYVKAILEKECDNVWLWKEIPEHILIKEGIIQCDDYGSYINDKNDVGIDILCEKNNIFTYVQCKNYTETITADDISGYLLFKDTYPDKNYKLYYNGTLSSRIMCMMRRRKDRKDEYVLCKPNYENERKVTETANHIFIPRDYQIEAYNLLKDKNRSILSLPCGMGKTYTGSLLCKDQNNIIMFAPTRSLAQQLHMFMSSQLPNHTTFLISTDGIRDLRKIRLKDKNLIISTFDSCDVVNKIISKMKNPYILIDEYHNLSQNDLDKKENQLCSILHSKHKILFMSATPRYLDRKEIFGNTIFKYDWNKAIQNGYINNFDIVLPGDGFNNFDINDFLKLFSLNDCFEHDSSNIKKMYYIMRNILYNGNRKCIIYFTSIEKANINRKILEWMSMLFNVDMNIDVMSCETNRKERELIFERFESSEKISILLNIQILNEGIDIPSCDSIYITKPNDNIDNIIQRMSRCNRIYPKKKKSTVYLWCNQKKADKVIEYINNNTGGQMEGNIIKVNDIYVKKGVPEKFGVEKNVGTTKISNAEKKNFLNCQENISIKEFIKKNSDIPNQFLDDFECLIDEDYDEKKIAVNFEKIVDLLKVGKGHLKRLLVDNFKKEYDYEIINSKMKHKTGAVIKENIFVTTICFKELCVMSRTEGAKKIKRYISLIDVIIKKYNKFIKNELNKKIKLYTDFHKN